MPDKFTRMPITETETLDPQSKSEWEEMRRCFHEAADFCIQAMRDVRERPVWQPMPADQKARLTENAPTHGQPLPETLAQFEEAIFPYGTGNTHPRFFGWVHGSGNLPGVLGEMLAAFMNCNVGGRDHSAATLERQIVAWCQEIFGFAPSGSGILTSGTSMGTLIALTVARDAKASIDIRERGLGALPKPLVGYASHETHASVVKAFELMGLGRNALRLVPVNSAFQMDTDALAAQIADDRADGFEPFAVVAAAGTVNTGAIDPLDAVADICRDNGLWMHVDGAFGGLAILTPEFREILAPIARADSIAFDFHKWLHVPYDAGCVLLQDEAAHRRTFSARHDYIGHSARGLSGGDPWFCEYGPEMSRGFRALKIWFTLQTVGLARLGELIARNCRQAQALGAMVQARKSLELLAPVTLNVVCFRMLRPGLSEAATDALNLDIVAELQLQGIAAPSTTRLGGKVAIRVALTNHRTQTEDLEILINAVCSFGETLLGETHGPETPTQ
jgi:aromatic-L-amino-acid decarboxylase